MKIIQSENKSLLVPTRVEADGMIGDMVLEITPEHIDYEEYLQQYEREQRLENDNEENREGLRRAK